MVYVNIVEAGKKEKKQKEHIDLGEIEKLLLRKGEIMNGDETAHLLRIETKIDDLQKSVANGTTERTVIKWRVRMLEWVLYGSFLLVLGSYAPTIQKGLSQIFFGGSP